MQKPFIIIPTLVTLSMMLFASSVKQIEKFDLEGGIKEGVNAIKTATEDISTSTAFNHQDNKEVKVIQGRSKEKIDINTKIVRKASLPLKKLNPIVNYVDIKYVLDLERYSIIDKDKDAFKEFLSRNEIPKREFKHYFGDILQKKHITMTALAYDWLKHMPNIAENYYRLLYKNKDKISIYYQIYMADYFIRTGRANKAFYSIDKIKCGTAGINTAAKCNYYRGVALYLKKGESYRKNSFLLRCSDKIEMAKKIIYKKDN
jgi:hypothetical protein